MWSNPLTYTAIVAALGLIVTIGVLIFKGGAWKGTVDAFMRDTKEALDTLLKRTEPAIERSSPVRLTEFGQEIGRRLEADTDLETSGTHGLPLPDGHHAGEWLERPAGCPAGQAVAVAGPIRRRLRSLPSEEAA